MWKKNLSIAIRSLRKNKLFTAINVLGLTAGMAATLLIYIWVHNELTFDTHYQHTDQIHRILFHWNGAGERININVIPIRLKDVASEQIPEIEEFYLLRPEDFSKPLIKLQDGTIFEEKELAFIGENWLEEFGYQTVEGSIAAFNADKYSIALTRSKAEQYFGTAPALGQTVEIFSSQYTVRLILEESLPNSSFHFGAYLPLASRWSDQAAYEADYNNGNYNYVAFCKIRPDADLEKIADQLAAIVNETDEDNRNSCSIVPMADMRFDQMIAQDYFPHQHKSAVYIFAIIGLVILLTAGLNYINLSTALISKRVKEIGVKKIIGASFRHIFSQIMLETSLMSLVAFIGALSMVQLLLPALSRFVEIPLRLDLSSPSVWLILLGIIGLSVGIAGVYPAMVSAGFKPIQLLRGKNVAGKGATLRNALVVAQFASAIMVLAGTFIMYQQLLFIQQKDVGYDRTQVIEISPNLVRGEDFRRNFDQFELFSRELANLPGFEGVVVTDAALSNITNQNSGSLDWEGKVTDLNVNVHQFRANEDLLTVFDLSMQDGRWFSPDLTSDQNNLILNETAVRRFSIPEPVVGRKSSFQGREGQIIGVVKDFNYTSLHEAVEPLVIWHNNRLGNTILARINGAQTEAALRKAEDLFSALLPDIPFEYAFLDDTFQQMHRADTKMSVLFQLFTGLLIFISCLGLFGLAVFAAERRVKEIGVRKVLGASVANIVSLLSKDFLKLVGVAILVATPVAWYGMNLWLQNFSYRIEIGWQVFVMAGVLAIGIAFLTVSLQSVKAALANPVESLRSE